MPTSTDALCEDSKMKIIDQGVIYSGIKNTRHAIFSFPSLVQLSCGKVSASFQAASRKNAIDSDILLSHSSDGGKTWKEPFAPFGNDATGEKDVVHICEHMAQDRSV